MNKIAIALSLAVAGMPLVARADCAGNACNAVSVKEKRYDGSVKRATAWLVNKDQNLPIHVRGCITVGGKCNDGGEFDTILKPGETSITVPLTTDKFEVNIKSAAFQTPSRAESISEPPDYTRTSISVKNSSKGLTLQYAVYDNYGHHNWGQLAPGETNLTYAWVTYKGKGKAEAYFWIDFQTLTGEPPVNISGYYCYPIKKLIEKSDQSTWDIIMHKPDPWITVELSPLTGKAVSGARDSCL